MKHGTIVMFLALSAGCRQPVPVDTSQAQFIPVPVAVENLRELLLTAEVVGCTVPKAIFEQKEIKEWKVDAAAIEFQVEGRPPFRVGYPDITATRVDRILGGYQVRLFTAAQTDPKKDHVHFNLRDETRARRTIELIDALRLKR